MREGGRVKCGRVEEQLAVERETLYRHETLIWVSSNSHLFSIYFLFGHVLFEPKIKAGGGIIVNAFGE